jgi:hypothetical protein
MYFRKGLVLLPGPTLDGNPFISASGVAETTRMNHHAQLKDKIFLRK